MSDIADVPNIKIISASSLTLFFNCSHIDLISWEHLFSTILLFPQDDSLSFVTSKVFSNIFARVFGLVV